MPSTHEGLPLVLLEAMAAGAPVVCSALPELLETGRDAVVAVGPLTARSAGRSARRPARRPRRAASACRQPPRSRAAAYAWPAVAAAVDALYQRVRAERR